MLAFKCAHVGRLNAATLDDHQVAGFDFAWKEAEVVAAETLLHAPAHDVAELRLANLFAVDTFASTAARQEPILIEIGGDLSQLRAAQDDSNAMRIRRDAAAPYSLNSPVRPSLPLTPTPTSALSRSTKCTCSCRIHFDASLVPR